MSAAALELLGMVSSIEQESGRLPHPGEQLGPYRVTRRVGEGGMGVVFDAVDERLGRRVALKVCRRGLMGEQAAERFLREARALAAFRHSNIVQIYDVCQSDHLMYYAMEFVDGPSLEEILRDGAWHGPRRRLALAFADVARALHVVHEAGLVHRDVKPSNILVAEDGRLVLADFGVVHWDVLATLTQTAEVPGTPAFMAPEQIEGAPATPANDQYGLCAVLYQALTGTWPLRALPIAEIVRRHRFEGVARPRQLRGELEPELDSIVARGLAREPSARHASLAALANALTEYGEAPDASEALEGTVIGSYRMGPRIGAGAMGTVYRATRLGNGETVAVKVLHQHRFGTKALLRRLRREAEAGRQVAHPHVVGVLAFDVTVHAGQPLCYLAMEYVAGRTLRETLDADGPLGEPLLREIGRQAAEGLAAVHEAGLVHGDVKPDNIILDEHQQVRLMDLGIAQRLETARDTVLGSLRYAAPEQAAGGASRPNADLYALGVTLFELAAGTPPFSQDDPAALILAHQAERPPALDGMGLSDFFQAVCATLLAKLPDARFASARDLATTLAEGESSAWWEGARGTSIRRRALPRISVSSLAPLVGRDGDLEALAHDFETVRSGAGRGVVIAGEYGIGKTRLVREFVSSLREAGATVLYGSFRHQGGLSALGDAIEGYVAADDVSSTLAEILPDRADAIPILTSLVRLGTARDAAGAASARAVGSALDALASAIATDTPTVVILDDVHDASDDARKALSFAMAREQAGVLWIVTTEPQRERPIGALLPNAPISTHLQLDRLRYRAVHRLVESILGSEPAASTLAPRLHRATDGIPYFLLELIEDLRRRGALESDGSAQRLAIPTDEVKLPSTVHGLIDGQLDALTPEERQVLEVGAVQGMVFDPAIVSAVCGLSHLRTLQLLAGLERRTGIIRNAPEQVSFDLRPARDVLYAQLTDDLRRECHALVAEALDERRVERFGAASLRGEEATDPLERAERGAAAALIALHHMRGSRPEAGLAAVQGAVPYLNENHRMNEAIELAARARSCVGGLHDPRGLRYLVLEADSMIAEGDLAGARDLIAKGEEGAGPHHPPVDRAWLLRIRGYLLRFAGQATEALKVLRRALEFAESSSDQAEEGRVRTIMGAVCLQLGKLDACEAQFREVIRIGEDLQDLRMQWVNWNNLGIKHRETGELGLALSCSERACALAAEVQPESLPWILALSSARAQILVGLHDEAEATLDRLLQEAGGAGDRRMLMLALDDLSLARSSRGDHEAALEPLHEALQLRQEIEARWGEPYSYLDLADIHAALGNEDARLVAIRKAQECSAELPSPAPEVMECAAAAVGLADAAQAEAAVTPHLEGLGRYRRMAVRYLLWQATGLLEHLRAAQADLEALSLSVSPERREAVLTATLTARNVHEACKGRERTDAS